MSKPEHRSELILAPTEIDIVSTRIATDIPASEVRDAFLNVGAWEMGEFTFATGKTANNKVNAERLAEVIERPRQELCVVLAAIGRVAIAYQPDAIWGVPFFGQELARGLHQVTGLPLIELIKDLDEPNLKTFCYRTKNDLRRAQNSRKKIGIEDITNELTSTRGALQLPELLFDTEAIVTTWRRGDPSQEKKISVPLHALVAEVLPNHITAGHPFFQEFGHKAARTKEVDG